MNVYDLSRIFWDYAFENPEKIKPNHIAMYFFAIEHCNRLGWKEKFGFPTTMVMDAISIKSYNTYIKTLNELVDYGFIKMIERSKNQYSANIIALSKYDKANDKALDKALIKHTTKQSESTVQSIGESNDSIDKQIYNNTNLPINNILLEKESKEEKIEKENSESDFDSETVNTETQERKKVAKKKERFKPPSVDEVQAYCNERQNGIQAFKFVNFYQSKGWKVGNQAMKDWKAAIRTWEQKNKENGQSNNNNSNNGFSSYSGNTTMGTGGKKSASSILAERARQQSSGNGYGGNFSTET